MKQDFEISSYNVMIETTSKHVPTLARLTSIVSQPEDDLDLIMLADQNRNYQGNKIVPQESEPTGPLIPEILRK